MKVTPSFFQKNRRKKNKTKEIPSCLIPHLHVLIVFTQQLEISLTKLLPVQLTKYTNSPVHEIRALQIFLVTKTNYIRPHSEIKPAGQTNRAQHV